MDVDLFEANPGALAPGFDDLEKQYKALKMNMLNDWLATSPEAASLVKTHGGKLVAREVRVWQSRTNEKLKHPSVGGRTSRGCLGTGR